jgi:hypothetical protein
MRGFMVLGLVLACGSAASASEVASLPIREVTAFKDGHALVVRSGVAEVSPDGDVVLADLPRPVLGTFWAHDDEDRARLASVAVERTMAPSTRPAITVVDLLRANIGRHISFRDPSGEMRSGVLLDVLEREPSVGADERARAPVWNGYAWVQPPGLSPGAAQRVALIQEQGAVAALPIDEVRDVRFEGDAPSGEIVEDVETERMTLDLEWEGDPGDSAAVTLMYLQRGLRWIPSYRITMLDGGRARIELQATLVNELADLDRVTLHAAIGAPVFEFEHTLDPLALRESLDQLGLFFQRATDGRTGALLSNALMGQGARMSEAQAAPASGGGAAAPSLAGGERAEDLFVFTVRDVTLARGARMTLPLVSYEVEVESLYRLDLAPSPPVQGLRQFDTQQQRDLARLLARPTPRHLLRIRNENDGMYPITTAPALVVKDGRTLAQGMLTYAAPGASIDLEVGRAVDIAIDTDERETDRTVNALRFDGSDYSLVEVGFEAEVVNRKPHAVTIEIHKLAFGAPVSVGQDGEAIRRSVFGDAFDGWADGDPWWRSYGWPHYWHRLNGAAEFVWTIELDAGAATTLNASWQYYWD